MPIRSAARQAYKTVGMRDKPSVPHPHSHLHHPPRSPPLAMLASRTRFISALRSRPCAPPVIPLAFALVRCYSVPAELPVPKKTKVWASADEAVKDVKSGDVVLSGGLLGLAPFSAFGFADVSGFAQVSDFAAFQVSLLAVQRPRNFVLTALQKL